jgi:hypothetical protein
VPPDAPEDDAPDDDAPDDDAPDDDAPDDVAPDDPDEDSPLVPDDDAPDVEFSPDVPPEVLPEVLSPDVLPDAPEDDAPLDDAPLDDAPLDDAPVEESPDVSAAAEPAVVVPVIVRIPDVTAAARAVRLLTFMPRSSPSPCPTAAGSAAPKQERMRNCLARQGQGTRDSGGNARTAAPRGNLAFPYVEWADGRGFRNRPGPSAGRVRRASGCRASGRRAPGSPRRSSG